MWFSVFRHLSRASPGRSGRHSTLHCCLPLETRISLLNSPSPPKKKTQTMVKEQTLLWFGTICLVFCLLGKQCPPQSPNDRWLYEMETIVSHSPATACPLPDLWHYPHVPLHLAESQVSPVTDLSHGCVSLLGNLHTQENHSPLDTSQDSRAGTFPCILYVLVAEGKGGGWVPRAVHYQPEGQMKRISSSSTWEPRCWSSCCGSLHSQLWSSQSISQNGVVLSWLLFSPTLRRPQLRGKTEGTQSVPGQGWGGSFHFLPAYIHAE